MIKKILVVVSALFLTGCQTTLTESRPFGHSFRGTASWYSSGSRTASGEHFNPNGISVAHRSLPFGTILHLTNPSNGRKIKAVVNDRGPFIKGRVIDVSKGAARALGFVEKGTTPLIIEVENERRGNR
jgi:rare lipoprotein A